MVVEALVIELLVLVLLFLAEVVVVASLPIFSVRSVLSLFIQPMFVISSLMFRINLMNHCVLLIQPQQYIPYPTSSFKTSNTWINPNNKSGHNTQASAMLIKFSSQGNTGYQILEQVSMLLVNLKT